MSVLTCSVMLVDETLEELRTGGHMGKERVVLWLSPRPLGTTSVIAEFYVPEQEAKIDYFRIPQSGMMTLMSYLRTRKLALAAQVHSHPGQAFHSRADDKWAIVRHEGALSIVVPNFAAGTSADNFLSAAAVFRLTSDDRWLKVERSRLPELLRLT